MVAHAILFIVTPLAVAWFAGVTACLPPYSLLPARKTNRSNPSSSQRSGRSWPSAANLTLRPAGALRRRAGNTLNVMSNLADCMRIEATLRVHCRSSRRAGGARARAGQGASRHVISVNNLAQCLREPGDAAMLCRSSSAAGHSPEFEAAIARLSGIASIYPGTHTRANGSVCLTPVADGSLASDRKHAGHFAPC